MNEWTNETDHWGSTRNNTANRNLRYQTVSKILEYVEPHFARLKLLHFPVTLLTLSSTCSISSFIFSPITPFYPNRKGRNIPANINHNSGSLATSPVKNQSASRKSDNN
ncbi:hypothetical protein PUN28_005865 [Cardiocondyla obscurior]|uniref:Uncharacterized protein n=1 Tax=Cardiocondyla obscurior TaxID=286306 RepID=A0AAW2G5W3_9HYME